jgi:hypothetical protein
MADERGETNLRTFNTAKKYAEEILFPKMNLYQRFQRQADFGDEDLDKAKEMSDDVRDIQRYNGLKGMNDVLYNLLVNITSTVRLKGNKKEIDELGFLITYVNKIKLLFYEGSSRFFQTEYRVGEIVEFLDRKYFEKVKEIINGCYINVEILMTRNKLLFSDASDEYQSDEEILKGIKQEYIEN